MNLSVGLRIARKHKNPSASNLAEILEIYPDNKARIQHLEGGRRQTIVDVESLMNNWKAAPKDPEPDTSVKLAGLEIVVVEQEKRIATLEARVNKLVSALGGV